eukprot:2154010-Rhodomonas_salina.9
MSKRARVRAGTSWSFRLHNEEHRTDLLSASSPTPIPPLELNLCLSDPLHPQSPIPAPPALLAAVKRKRQPGIVHGRLRSDLSRVGCAGANCEGCSRVRGQTVRTAATAGA